METGYCPGKGETALKSQVSGRCRTLHSSIVLFCLQLEQQFPAAEAYSKQIEAKNTPRMKLNKKCCYRKAPYVGVHLHSNQLLCTV